MKYIEINDQKLNDDNSLKIPFEEKPKENINNICLEDNTNISLSKFPICKECGENVFIEYNESKIKLYGCKNGHDQQNINFDEYEKTINTNKECDKCKNKKYRCNICKINICTACQINHNHKVICNEDINYICEIHNKQFKFYCKNCKQNLCYLCKENHNVHEIIDFDKIIPNIEESKIRVNKLRKVIDKFNNDINRVINKVKEIIELHYKINKNLIDNFDKKKLNYEIIQNINYINKNNENIIEKISDFKVTKIEKLINEINNLYTNNIILKYKVNGNDKVKIFGNNFVQNNKNLCLIKYKNQEYNLTEYLDVDSNENEIEIILKRVNNITDASYMFSGCSSLFSLDNISKWNIINVKNMNRMFERCSQLVNLPDITNWETSNVKDMGWMFSKCSSLESFPDISKWNTSHVKDMSWMFYECSSLKFLPDISNWNISNVINIDSMFRNCVLLKSLPDLSKWDTSNITSTNSLFSNCSSLLTLPDISKWDTNNIYDMGNMFSCCLSLEYLPKISKWNVSKVKTMEYMFERCSSLYYIPDISVWNTPKLENINHMFSECSSLLKAPNISKWNQSNLKNKYDIFSKCFNILNIPKNYN